MKIRIQLSLLRFTKIILTLLFLIVTGKISWGQLPVCTSDSSLVYVLTDSGKLYNWNPYLPFSGINPALNTIGLPPSPFKPYGLAVSTNLNSLTGPSPTFYVVGYIGASFIPIYFYYDGSTWINTGHIAGSTNAFNIGAGGGYIYSLDAYSGSIFKYDGTGNAVQIVTITDFNNGGPFDLVADCNGNFYILKCGPNGWLRKYNSSGTLLYQWTITGAPTSLIGYALAIVGNLLLFSTDQIYSGTVSPTGTSIPVTPLTGSFPMGIYDFGSCTIGGSNINAGFILSQTPSQNDSGCAPYTVSFMNNSTSANAYMWNFDDGTATTSLTNVTHTFTDPGVYTVTLYASNDYSCNLIDTAYKTISVFHTEIPNITIQDTVLCSLQQSVPINVIVNNPSPNNAILWGPPTGILSSPTMTSINIDPSLNNLYWVTVKDTVPGICGFSVTDTVHIDLSPRVLHILNDDTAVCNGAVVQINALGSPGYSYAWSPSTGVNDTALLSPTITINQPNIYTVRASYPNCPDTLVSINIGMQYIPTLELGANKAVCQWTEVAFESTITPYRPDYIYQWTPSAGLSYSTGPNTDLIADTSGTWYLDVKTPIGCASRDSIKLIVYPGNFGAAATDTGYCPPSEVQLWATGGVSYSWTPAYGLNDTSSANPVASPLTTTDYTVYIKDIHNCLDTQKLTVSVYPLALLTLPDSINIYPGEQYQVEPGTNCLYFQWFPSSGVSNANISDPKLSPEVRTRYFITATTEHGCTVSDSMDVMVKETVLDMPNAFAPNGTNNLFKPTKRGIAQLKSFAIFNRWGNKVYNSSNIDEGWDGTFNGSDQPMGVYIYTIEAVTDKGQIFRQQGNVTLIR
jgi:gliding motility-associated-like protein